MQALLDWFRSEPPRDATYADWLYVAFKRTRRLRLDPPLIQVSDRRVLTNTRNLEALSRVVQELVAPLGPELVAGNCAPVTAMLVEPVAKALSCPAYFTLGWINIGRGEHSRDVFRMAERDIRSWLRGNLPTLGQASYHCWLTLPTMEIVDATIATTQAVANDRQRNELNVVTSHADEMANLRYRPMLIGASFLERSGWSVTL